MEIRSSGPFHSEIDIYQQDNAIIIKEAGSDEAYQLEALSGMSMDVGIDVVTQQIRDFSPEEQQRFFEELKNGVFLLEINKQESGEIEINYGKFDKKLDTTAQSAFSQMVEAMKGADRAMNRSDFRAALNDGLKQAGVTANVRWRVTHILSSKLGVLKGDRDRYAFFAAGVSTISGAMPEARIKDVQKRLEQIEQETSKGIQREVGSLEQKQEQDVVRRLEIEQQLLVCNALLEGLQHSPGNPTLKSLLHNLPHVEEAQVEPESPHSLSHSSPSHKPRFKTLPPELLARIEPANLQNRAVELVTQDLREEPLTEERVSAYIAALKQESAHVTQEVFRAQQEMPMRQHDLVVKPTEDRIAFLEEEKRRLGPINKENALLVFGIDQELTVLKNTLVIKFISAQIDALRSEQAGLNPENPDHQDRIADIAEVLIDQEKLLEEYNQQNKNIQKNNNVCKELEKRIDSVQNRRVELHKKLRAQFKRDAYAKDKDEARPRRDKTVVGNEAEVFLDSFSQLTNEEVKEKVSQLGLGDMTTFILSKYKLKILQEELVMKRIEMRVDLLKKEKENLNNANNGSQRIDEISQELKYWQQQLVEAQQDLEEHRSELEGMRPRSKEFLEDDLTRQAREKRVEESRLLRKKEQDQNDLRNSNRLLDRSALLEKAQRSLEEGAKNRERISAERLLEKNKKMKSS